MTRLLKASMALAFSSVAFLGVAQASASSDGSLSGFVSVENRMVSGYVNDGGLVANTEVSALNLQQFTLDLVPTQDHTDFFHPGFAVGGQYMMAMNDSSSVGVQLYLKFGSDRQYVDATADIAAVTATTAKNFVAITTNMAVGGALLAEYESLRFGVGYLRTSEDHAAPINTGASTMPANAGVSPLHSLPLTRCRCNCAGCCSPSTCCELRDRRCNCADRHALATCGR